MQVYILFLLTVRARISGALHSHNIVTLRTEYSQRRSLLTVQLPYMEGFCESSDGPLFIHSKRLVERPLLEGNMMYGHNGLLFEISRLFRRREIVVGFALFTAGSTYCTLLMLIFELKL